MTFLSMAASSALLRQSPPSQVCYSEFFRPCAPLVSLTAAMKGSQAGESEHRVRFRPGKWIVASQVASSLVVLVVAGLFLRSLVKLITLDLGFDRSNVLTVNANLKGANIQPERRLVVYDEIESRLHSLPGVVSVGRSSRIPISNYEWTQRVEVDTSNPPKGDDAQVYFNFISPGYFQTLRTPLLAGRKFNDRDTKTSVQVAIVNETFAHRFLPNRSPIGAYFRKVQVGSKPLFQIVGLVRDSKYESVREDDVAAVLVGGAAAGALASLLTVRFLQKMLFGLVAHDPITLIAAIGLLSAVALLAGYFPARRAMKMDPIVALRYQ